MEVEGKLEYSRFKKKYPNKSKYLQDHCEPETPVLISRNFYYFGKNAFNLPKNIRRIIVHKQGCKKVSESDIARLKKHQKALFNAADRVFRLKNGEARILENHAGKGQPVAKSA
jgi:hypothetical protein